jgi:hypothetical protein
MGGKTTTLATSYKGTTSCRNSPSNFQRSNYCPGDQPLFRTQHLTFQFHQYVLLLMTHRRHPGEANMSRVSKESRSSATLTARKPFTNAPLSRQASQFPRGQPLIPSQTPSRPAVFLTDQLHRSPLHYQNAIVMNTWLGEWDTAPNDPLPSYPDRITLLTEPTLINANTHARNAKKVFLCHFYEHMVPEGRVQQETRQRKSEERKAKKRSLQDACNGVATDAEKEDGRKKVQRAVLHAHVIDLTEDNVPAKFAPQPAATRRALGTLQQIRYPNPPSQAAPVKGTGYTSQHTQPGVAAFYPYGR